MVRSFRWLRDELLSAVQSEGGAWQGEGTGGHQTDPAGGDYPGGEAAPSVGWKTSGDL